MPANVQTYIGRQSAWHSLGTVTGKYQTWAEILAHGGLDFEVVTQPLFSQYGEQVAANGVFRFNKGVEKGIYLGVVGEGYTCINHAQGFELVDALMNTVDGAHYETAGVLGQGETVWGLADLGLRMHVGEDETRNYLLFATGHIGNMTYTFRTCATRVVCQNTLNVAMGEKIAGKFKVKHTRFAQNRISEAHEVLAGLQNDTLTMEKKLNLLAQKKVTRKSMQSIFDRLFPQKKDEKGNESSSTRRNNIISDILATYESNDFNAFPEQRGTAYNLLNAITNYTDHSRSTKGDMRAESALFGSGDKLKTNTLAVILDVAEGMPERLARVSGQGQEVDWESVGIRLPERRN